MSGKRFELFRPQIQWSEQIHAMFYFTSSVLLNQLLRHSVITQTGDLGHVVAGTSDNKTVPVLWHVPALSQNHQYL